MKKEKEKEMKEEGKTGEGGKVQAKNSNTVKRKKRRQFVEKEKVEKSDRGHAKGRGARRV